MVAFVASLVMGFLIGFFLEAAIGMIGFWFLEVSSLLFVYMLFSFFLVRAHVSADAVARRHRNGGELSAVQVPGLFPGRDVSGKDSRKTNCR